MNLMNKWQDVANPWWYFRCVAQTSVVTLEKSFTLADVESLCVLEVLSRQITKRMDNGEFGVMRVRYVCSQKKEQRVNLVVPLCIANEAKDLPCVMIYTGLLKSEGNRDYCDVCTVTGSRGETIPNLATRLRKLSRQNLCSDVIVDSLSSFPDRTMFACWGLEMVQSKNIKRGWLYAPAKWTSSVKPDDAYVIRFNGSKTSKNISVHHDLEVLGCEEDLFVQGGEEEEFPVSQVMWHCIFRRIGPLNCG